MTLEHPHSAMVSVQSACHWSRTLLFRGLQTARSFQQIYYFLEYFYAEGGILNASTVENYPTASGSEGGLFPSDDCAVPLLLIVLWAGSFKVVSVSISPHELFIFTIMLKQKYPRRQW